LKFQSCHEFVKTQIVNLNFLETMSEILSLPRVWIRTISRNFSLTISATTYYTMHVVKLTELDHCALFRSYLFKCRDAWRDHVDFGRQQILRFDMMNYSTAIFCPAWAWQQLRLDFLFGFQNCKLEDLHRKTESSWTFRRNWWNRNETWRSVSVLS